MKSAEEFVESNVHALPRGENVRETWQLRSFTMGLFQQYTRLVLSAYCPTHVIGRENLPPAPFLLCSNHCSHMDSTVLMVAAGQSFDRFGLIAAQDYFVAGGRWKRALKLLVNVLPVDRRATRKTIAEHLDQCRRFIAGGQRSLIMYPEGTRSTNGAMRPFKRGAGMLAVELGIPIVPAYIQGTFQRWPKGTRLIRPGKIRVALGRPIYPRDFAQGDTDANSAPRHYARLTEELESRVAALKAELGHGA